MVPGGVTWSRGCCLVPGGAWPRGCAWSRGCVPSPRGVHGPRGVCLVLGGCMVLGGVPGPRGCMVLGGTWSQGGVPCPGGCMVKGGVPGPGGCMVPGRHMVPGDHSPGGVCLVLEGAWSQGGGILTCTEADLPPVNRMTDRCKNITFVTSLRTVIIGFSSKIRSCPPPFHLGNLGSATDYFKLNLLLRYSFPYSVTTCE